MTEDTGFLEGFLSKSSKPFLHPACKRLKQNMKDLRVLFQIKVPGWS